MNNTVNPFNKLERSRTMKSKSLPLVTQIEFYPSFGTNIQFYVAMVVVVPVVVVVIVGESLTSFTDLSSTVIYILSSCRLSRQEGQG